MEAEDLTPEELAEAQRIEDIVLAKARVDVRDMARLLASKPDRKLFGATEFQLRDISHRIASYAVDAALDGRKKGGIKGPASPAKSAPGQPSS
jgi:hypothetical protein